MRRFFSVTAVLFLSVSLFSCGRHEPPEDIVRNLCEENITGTIVAEGRESRGLSAKDLEVNILEINRKGVGESKNTRGIPDKTLVYPIGCLFETTVDGVESEPKTTFLYFFRNSVDGGWLVRER